MTNKMYQNIDDIVTAYFVSKNNLEKAKLSSGEEEFFNPSYLLYRDIELAFQSLDDDEQLIIRNDYFEKIFPGWWKLAFKQSEYQSIKKRAIRKFVRSFNEIH